MWWYLYDSECPIMQDLVIKNLNLTSSSFECAKHIRQGKLLTYHSQLATFINLYN